MKPKRGTVYWCFIDLERAFDKVCRQKLRWMLRNKGIRRKYIENLEGIYADISFKIRVNNYGETTKTALQTEGLRQGCNLSPYLFILFIDDIINETELSKTHSPSIGNIEIPGLLFADDLCLISTSKIGLQKKIDYVDNYCKKWDLKININKTKILVGKKGSKLSAKEVWFLKGNKIEIVKNFKYLGIIMNYNGMWDKQSCHAKIIGNNAFNEIVKLRNKIPNVKSKLLQETYRAIVESRMLYGVEVWGDISTEILIDRMRAKLAKLVLNLPLYASSDGARCEMGSISGLEIILI